MAVHHKPNLLFDCVPQNISLSNCDTENTVANLNTMRCDSFVTYCDFSLQGYYLYQRCNAIFYVS